MDLAIPIGFLLVVVLLLWLLIGAKGKLPLKLITVVACCYYCIAVWVSLGSYMGYPTTQDLPDQFFLRAVIIEEPDKKAGTEGAIYLWISHFEGESKNVFETLTYDAKPGEVRVHRIKYRRTVHERLNGVMGALRRGIPVMGGKALRGEGEGEGQGDATGGDPGRGDGDRRGQGGAGFSQEQEPHFYVLPPSMRIPKRDQ